MVDVIVYRVYANFISVVSLSVGIWYDTWLRSYCMILLYKQFDCSDSAYSKDTASAARLL